MRSYVFKFNCRNQYDIICIKILMYFTLVSIKYWYIEFYIHGSVHRNSILISSNKMQHYEGIYLLQITLNVSGVYRTHHQEYIKL